MDIRVDPALITVLLRNMNRLRRHNPALTDELNSMERELINRSHIYFPTEIEDINYLLMSTFDDNTLLNVCQINKQTSELCRNEAFWKKRIIDVYKPLPEFRKYKLTNISYKKLYLTLRNPKKIALFEAIKLGIYPLVASLWNDRVTATNQWRISKETYKKYFIYINDKNYSIKNSDFIDEMIDQIYPAEANISKDSAKVFYIVLSAVVANAAKKGYLDVVAYIMDRVYISLYNSERAVNEIDSILKNNQYAVIQYIWNNTMKYGVKSELNNLCDYLVRNLDKLDSNGQKEILSIIPKKEMIKSIKRQSSIKFDIIEMIMSQYHISPQKMLKYWDQTEDLRHMDGLDQFIRYHNLEREIKKYPGLDHYITKYRKKLNKNDNSSNEWSSEYDDES